ncbi:10583_t:CDS:1, partial [Racocetra persica]
MSNSKPLTDVTNIKNHNLRNRTVFVNPISYYKQPSNPTTELLEQFFSLYNARLATSCDFFVWRILNEIGLPINDKRVEMGTFLTTVKKFMTQDKWSKVEIQYNLE